MQIIRSLIKSRRIEALLVSIILALTLSACSILASPLPTLDKNIEQVIAAHLTESNDSNLQKKPIPAANVRTIVHDRLNASLLANTEKMTGMDYHFIITGQQTETQIAVLILSYPDETTAARMARILSKSGNYFKQSEIVTPFSAAASGSQIVIVFTEKAGNDTAVKFVRDFPGYLKAQH